VGELEVDGAAGEHDEREGGVGGVEPVGASHDEPDLGVEAFDAAVADPVLERVDDQPTAFAHGAGALDERCQPGALRPGAPAVEQHDRVGGVEVAGEG